jgi:hypothetical protein
MYGLPAINQRFSHLEDGTLSINNFKT